jgi:hypothetical protein
MLIPQFGKADPYPLAIDVSGFKSRSQITDVNVTLRDFSHGIAADVDLQRGQPERPMAAVRRRQCRGPDRLARRLRAENHGQGQQEEALALAWNLASPWIANLRYAASPPQ